MAAAEIRPKFVLYLEKVFVLNLAGFCSKKLAGISGGFGLAKNCLGGPSPKTRTLLDNCGYSKSRFWVPVPPLLLSIIYSTLGLINNQKLLSINRKNKPPKQYTIGNCVSIPQYTSNIQYIYNVQCDVGVIQCIKKSKPINQCQMPTPIFLCMHMYSSLYTQNTTHLHTA